MTISLAPPTSTHPEMVSLPIFDEGAAYKLARWSIGTLARLITVTNRKKEILDRAELSLPNVSNWLNASSETGVSRANWPSQQTMRRLLDLCADTSIVPSPIRLSQNERCALLLGLALPDLIHLPTPLPELLRFDIGNAIGRVDAKVLPRYKSFPRARRVDGIELLMAKTTARIEQGDGADGKASDEPLP